MDGASHLIIFLLRIQNKNIWKFMFNVTLVIFDGQFIWKIPKILISLS